MIDHRWLKDFCPRALARALTRALTRALATALVAVAMVALLAATGGARAWAQASDIFIVKDVEVDVTAKTAALARKQALAEGERDAFRRLLERMTLIVHRGDLPRPSPSETAVFVKDFSVEAEKTSAVRYLASLTYRFKAKEVRRYLTDYGLPFAETFSKPVLILPVFESAGALLLWDDPNPWREAWSRRKAIRGLVPMVLPLGDLADIATIGVEQALNGDEQRLAAIAGRYKASDTMVTHAIMRRDARSLRPELEVFLTRYGTALQEQTLVRNFAILEGETSEQMMARAAMVLSALVEDNWKQDNLLRLGSKAVAVVTVPIGGLKDWLDVRRRLTGVAVIRRAELVLLSTDEARINIHYIGDSDQLALALEQADLTLTRDAVGGWILAPRVSAAGIGAN